MPADTGGRAVSAVKPAPDKLFGDFQRTDSSPARDTEPSFDYLNRSAGAFWDNVRTELERWYAEYPDASRDLRSRFQDPDEHQDLAAWWELYTHTLFRRLGYEVEVHPPMSGSTKNPDFLVSGESTSFYVECVTMFGDANVDNPAGRAWICECTNRAKHPDFMVNLDIEQVGIAQPGVSQVTQPVEDWLETLDADAIRADVEAGLDGPRLDLTVRDPRARPDHRKLVPMKRKPTVAVIGAGRGGLAGRAARITPSDRQLLR
jgi:hypothetical protein